MGGGGGEKRGEGKEGVTIGRKKKKGSMCGGNATLTTSNIANLSEESTRNENGRGGGKDGKGRGDFRLLPFVRC